MSHSEYKPTTLFKWINKYSKQLEGTATDTDNNRRNDMRQYWNKLFLGFEQERAYITYFKPFCLTT